MIVHHLGIVVDKLDEAIPIFEVWMGARRVGGIVEDEVQQARIQLFAMNADTLLEVIEPIVRDPAGFHQVGEYHLCYTVPDLDAEMRRLHDLGAVIAHPTTPVPFFDNRRLGFMATTSGQLLELLEDPHMPVS